MMLMKAMEARKKAEVSTKLLNGATVSFFLCTSYLYLFAKSILLNS